MRAEIAGLVRQTKKSASGKITVYVYDGRGGPQLCSASGHSKAQADAELSRLLGTAAVQARLIELRAGNNDVITARISGLASSFKGSPEFKNLAASTKRAYTSYLDEFVDEFGDVRVKTFERWDTARDIVEWRNDYGNTPRGADYRMQTVSRLFSWGRAQHLTRANPTADIERLHRADRSDIIWSDEELSGVLAACAKDELRWAIQLASITGLRQSDLLRLPWSAVGDHAIVRKTTKRARTVVIPSHPAEDLLALIPRRSPTILTSSLGRPWSPDGLRSSFDAAKKLSGIDGKHWHDLRGTAATKLAKAGLTDSLIARWMGWDPKRVQQMREIYVSSDEVALDMLERINDERRPQTGDKLG